MAVVRRTSRPWLGWLALVLVAWFAVPARAGKADATPGFDIAPPPQWVESVEPNGSSFARDGALGGVALLVLDMQRMISEDSDWSYIHTVEEITNEAGVAAVGELTFEFSPPHERLVLHRVEIHRGGTVLSRLSPGAVQVLQRERSLEERLYDGSQTAVIVLPDVRVGDVIVREYSIVGRNPVFGADTAAHLTLEFGAPVGVVHASIASKRPLYSRTYGGAPEPEIETIDGVVRHRWHLDDVPAFARVDDVPSEVPLRSALLSTTSEWAEVGAWGKRLFRGTRDAPAALAPIVTTIRAENDGPEAQALAALRFVQDDVRYFALSLAESSHRPADPAVVLERRFGDCKDKSQLAVALLRELGVAAHVVLVATGGGDMLVDAVPNVRAFDHAIVAIDLAGRRVFVDPTHQLVRGGLADGGVRGYGHGLLLDEAGDLVEIPDAPQSVRDIDATSSYAFSAWGAPIGLELRIRYGDGTATAVRNRIAAESNEALRRMLLASVREQHPSAELDGDLELRDFADARGIDAVQRFRIAEWDRTTEGAAQLVVGPFLLFGRLPVIAPDRGLPLALPAPLQLRHGIEIRSPEPIAVETAVANLERGPVRATYSAKAEGGAIRVEYTLDVFHRRVEVSGLGTLRDDLDAVQEHYQFGIWETAPGADFSDADFDWTIVMVAGSWGLVVLMVLAVVHAKQPWLPLARVAYEPGLVGVGGLMWLLALRVSIQPGMILRSMWQGAPSLAGSQWHALTTPGAPSYHALWAPSLLFELCANLTLLVLGLYLAYAFWARRRAFQLVFLASLVLSLVVTIIDEQLGRMLPIEPEAGTGGELAEVVRTVGWGLYVVASSRVRSRFLPPPSDTTVPQ